MAGSKTKVPACFLEIWTGQPDGDLCIKNGGKWHKFYLYKKEVEAYAKETDFSYFAAGKR